MRWATRSVALACTGRGTDGRTDDRRGDVELLPAHEAPAKIHHGRFPPVRRPDIARAPWPECEQYVSAPVCLGFLIGHLFRKMKRLKIFNSPGREFAEIMPSKKQNRLRGITAPEERQ